MSVKIMKCKCEHKFQDKKYGKNKRVFNSKGVIKSGSGSKEFCCTICGTVKQS